MPLLQISVQSGSSRWNEPILHAGSVSEGTYTDVQYAIPHAVRLEHDRPWIVEWSSSGAWTTGSLLFSSSSYSKYEGNTYLFRRKNSSLIALGEYIDGTFYNYGVTLSNHGIDGTQPHVYTLKNRIASDGSNMVYLYVDGAELGPMNNYHLAGTSQGTISNWVNGKDFTFSYMGTSQHPLSECNLDYIRVLGNGLGDVYDEPDIFRWETQNDQLTSRTDGYTSNNATALSGSCSNGIYSGSHFALEKPVVLLHDRPWYIQWESSGSWKDNANGTLLLNSSLNGNAADTMYLYRRSNSEIIAFGERLNGKHHNYGLKLSDYGVDSTAKHTYLLSNEINADGTNMVLLCHDAGDSCQEYR